MLVSFKTHIEKVVRNNNLRIGSKNSFLVPLNIRWFWRQTETKQHFGKFVYSCVSS